MAHLERRKTASSAKSSPFTRVPQIRCVEAALREPLAASSRRPSVAIPAPLRPACCPQAADGQPRYRCAAVGVSAPDAAPAHTTPATRVLPVRQADVPSSRRYPASKRQRCHVLTHVQSFAARVVHLFHLLPEASAPETTIALPAAATPP